MRFAMPFLLAAAMPAGGASACEAPAPRIAVQYRVTEQVPERVEALVTNRVERVLAALPRLAGMRSTTGPGSVAIELQFEGGATVADLATVRQRLAEVGPGAGTGVTSSDASLTRACLRGWPWPEHRAPGPPAHLPGPALSPAGPPPAGRPALPW